MTGSKMTTMTVEQMRAARERGESQSDWEAVRQRIEAGIEPEEDEDSPEATKAIREITAKRRAGRRLDNMRDEDSVIDEDAPEITEEMMARAEVVRRSKEIVTLRLDTEVLEWFKAQGKGYQTRINAVLKAYMEAREERR